MLSRWEAYLADPAMVSCTTRSDCIVVGGQPPLDPCNGHSTIGYCGKAANAAAYAASPAPSLEAEFPATCPDHKGYDCGPAYPNCKNGKCIIEGYGCCHCPPPDASPDLPIGQRDGAWDGAEASGSEAGGPDVATPETGGGEAGSPEAGGQ